MVSFNQSLVVIYRFKLVILVSQEANRAKGTAVAAAILGGVTVMMNTVHMVWDKAQTFMVIKILTVMVVAKQVHPRDLTVVLVKGHLMVEVAVQVDKEGRILELVVVVALIARLPPPPAMLMAMLMAMLVVVVLMVEVQVEKGGHTAVMLALIARLPPLPATHMTMVVSKGIQGLIQVHMILMMKNQ